MTRTLRSLISILAITLVMTFASAVCSFAESYDYTNSCSFDGRQIVSTFKTNQFAQVVNDLQPGDDVTFTVEYYNRYSEATDWYMENAIVQTLEKTNAAKKVSGTGDAEGGAYKYELIHYDNEGNETILFNNVDDVVGGEDIVDGREGLEQATNALEDWFFIQTLEPEQHGTVVLKVAFEGETEVNDYMDTDGGLNVRFAVELANPGTGDNPPGKTVKTGDYTPLMRWVAIAIAASVLLIILAIFSDRRDRRQAYAEAGSGAGSAGSGKKTSGRRFKDAKGGRR